MFIWDMGETVIKRLLSAYIKSLKMADWIQRVYWATNPVTNLNSNSNTKCHWTPNWEHSSKHLCLTAPVGPPTHWKNRAKNRLQWKRKIHPHWKWQNIAIPTRIFYCKFAIPTEFFELKTIEFKSPLIKNREFVSLLKFTI